MRDERDETVADRLRATKPLGGLHLVPDAATPVGDRWSFPRAPLRGREVEQPLAGRFESKADGDDVELSWSAASEGETRRTLKGKATYGLDRLRRSHVRERLEQGGQELEMTLDWTELSSRTK